jgi:hypothetical protein
MERRDKESAILGFIFFFKKKKREKNGEKDR